jgi:hypothetical protein
MKLLSFSLEFTQLSLSIHSKLYWQLAAKLSARLDSYVYSDLDKMLGVILRGQLYSLKEECSHEVD